MCFLGIFDFWKFDYLGKYLLWINIRKWLFIKLKVNLKLEFIKVVFYERICDFVWYIDIIVSWFDIFNSKYKDCGSEKW